MLFSKDYIFNLRPADEVIPSSQADEQELPALTSPLRPTSRGNLSGSQRLYQQPVGRREPDLDEADRPLSKRRRYEDHAKNDTPSVLEQSGSRMVEVRGGDKERVYGKQICGVTTRYLPSQVGR